MPRTNFDDDVPDGEEDKEMHHAEVVTGGEVKKEEESSIFDDFEDYDGEQEEGSSEDDSSFSFDNCFSPRKNHNDIRKHDRCNIVGGTKGASGGHVVIVMETTEKMALVQDRKGNFSKNG